MMWNKERLEKKQSVSYTLSGVPVLGVVSSIGGRHRHTGKPWHNLGGLAWYDNRARWYHSGGYTKYCTDPDYGYGACRDNNYKGFVDNKTELDVDDDAAAANWGGGALMPSVDQIKELVNNCTWQWTQRNGVNGQLGTGPNGNTIFLPAAGERWDGSPSNAGTYGGFWSRTLRADDSWDAFNLCFNSGYAFWDSYFHRYYGRTVRAVRIPQNFTLTRRPIFYPVGCWRFDEDDLNYVINIMIHKE